MSYEGMRLLTPNAIGLAMDRLVVLEMAFNEWLLSNPIDGPLYAKARHVQDVLAEMEDSFVEALSRPREATPEEIAREAIHQAALGVIAHWREIEAAGVGNPESPSRRLELAVEAYERLMGSTETDTNKMSVTNGSGTAADGGRAAD